MFNTFFWGKNTKKKSLLITKKACTLKVFSHKSKFFIFRPNNCMNNVINIAIFTIIEFLIIIIIFIDFYLSLPLILHFYLLNY